MLGWNTVNSWEFGYQVYVKSSIVYGLPPLLFGVLLTSYVVYNYSQVKPTPVSAVEAEAAGFAAEEAATLQKTIISTR